MSASMATGLLLGFKQGRRQGLQLDHRNRISPPRGAQAKTILRFSSGTQEQQEHDRRCGPQDSREEWKAVDLGSSIETEIQKLCERLWLLTSRHPPTDSWSSTAGQAPEYNRCRKSEILLPALFSKHHAIKTAHFSYSNSTGTCVRTNKMQNCLLGLQGNHSFLPFLSIWTAALFQSFLLSPTLRQIHASSNSNVFTAKPMAFALSHTSDHTSGAISPKTSGTLPLSVPCEANSRHFSSPNISLFSVE